MRGSKEGFQTNRGERGSYFLFAFGQNMIYLLVTGYLALYCTDYLFLPPAAVSVIFLLAKIWDASNDVLFGLVVDRVHFRKTKFLPWLRASALLVPAVTVLLFHIPVSLPQGARAAALVFAYLLWDMAYTISDVPSFSLVTAMTGSGKERGTFLSYGNIAAVGCTVLFTVFFVPQIETAGFGKVSAAAAVLCMAAMIPLPLYAKERGGRYGKAQEKADWKEELRYLKQNRYLWIFYLFYIGSGIFNVSTTLVSYVLIYCIGSLKYQAVFTAVGVVPMLLIYGSMPRLMQRFDRMLLYKCSVTVSMLLGVVLYFTGYNNLPLFGGLVILRTLLAGPSSLLANTFTMDCIEFGHYRTGLRREGITFAVQSFANKFCRAVSDSLALLLLGLAGYQASAGRQSAGTLSLMWSAYCLLPAAGILLMLPVLGGWKLKTGQVQIMTDMNTGRISREEGEAALKAQGFWVK